ncbi:MAG: UDP-N-acetylmuramate dehydrogenase [Fimbriimonas sp.]
MNDLRSQVSLRPYTTLRVGGEAEWFATASSSQELADLSIRAQRDGTKATILGWGSNVLPSDLGVPGLVIHNRARSIEVRPGRFVVAESGCGLQDLFLKTLQCGLRGLEFAVGIPGTLGGALVSNAGAYRSSIEEFIVSLEVATEGKRANVGPEWMEFSYRDSKLRRPNPATATILSVTLRLPSGEQKPGYDEAREYQRQRIGKQPPQASAGSFFKNVQDLELANRLPGLPAPLREKGIVPAGYLIEACGLKGFRIGGAAVGVRHANFILNMGGATATEIRSLASHVRHVVREQMGAELEEEVLYIGDWTGFVPTSGLG